MQITVDDTTERFIVMLREVLEAEPPSPSPDVHEAHVLAEIGLQHYEWQRQVSALRLLIGVRLTGRALDVVEAD